MVQGVRLGEWNLIMAFSPKSVVWDVEYLLERAAAEVERADRARSTKSAEIHHQLASSYLDRAFGSAEGGGPPAQRVDRAGTRRALFEGICHQCDRTPVEAVSSELETLLLELHTRTE